MSSIWAKISPTCRCLSCTRSLAATRPNLARLRERLQLKHLTTLFYSTAIATAAAVDVRVKKARREQWDTLIAETERALRQTEAIQAPSEHFSSTTTQELMPNSNESKPHAESNSGSLYPLPRPLSRNRNKSSSVVRFLGTLDEDRATRDGRLAAYIKSVIQDPEKFQHDVPWISPSSVYASTARQESGSHYWTPGKLSVVEHSVAKLSARLLLTAISPEEAGVRKTIEDLRSLAESRLRIYKAKSRGGHVHLPALEYPRYTDLNHPTENNNDAALTLNIYIQKLFRLYSRDHESHWQEKLISQLANALLTSTVPPDIYTYNIIIGHLSRLGLYNEVEMAIESLMENNIRLSEVSAITILAHYKRAGNFEGFDKFVLKLLGYYRGIGLAHPETAPEKIDGIHFRRFKGRIIQCLPFDAPIYHQIIAGFLQFRKLESAYKWYLRMREDDFRLNLRLASEFLHEFARRRYWQDGLIFVRWVLEKITDDHKSCRKHRASHRTAYFYSLQLCKRCDKPIHFKYIYSKGLEDGFSMHELLKPESLSHGFSSSEAWKHRLEQKVSHLEHRSGLIDKAIRLYSANIVAINFTLTGVLNVKVKGFDTSLISVSNATLTGRMLNEAGCN